MLKNKLEKVRKKLCHKIIYFVFKNKINNKTLLQIIIFVYKVIGKGYAYEPEYIPECHHYIPRFILRNFRIGTTGEIYEYCNEGMSPEKKSIAKEAACIKNFYASTHIKTQKQSIYAEKEIYQFIETTTWLHIVKEGNYNNLTGPEKSTLAIYTAYQYTRTPAFRAQLKNFILFLTENRKVNPKIFFNKHKKEVIKLFLQNPLNVKRNELVEFNVKNKHENKDVETLLRTKLYNCNLDSILKLLCIIIGNDIAEHIFHRKLYLLEAQAPDDFILPDSGAMIYDFKDEYDYFLWPYGWSLEKKSISVFLPIATDKCLLFSYDSLDDIKIKKEYAKMAILLAYHQKHKYVYSNRKENIIQENLNKFPRTNYFD